MSSGTVFQVLVNLIFAAGMVAIWIRLNKPAKDDPRLSRGLQLLQSKIAILEDLSDQVERQVQQVAQLMEVKARDLQKHIEKSDDQIRQIETATAKSLEVARIFQDRIPHEEIIDRKSTLKYVKAARLANKGATTEEIAEQVNLSRGEIEFISKVNKDQLQFSEDDLPDWVTTEEPAPMEPVITEPQPLLRVGDHSTAPAALPLSELGKKFREALDAGVSTAAATTTVAADELNVDLMTEKPADRSGVKPFDRAAALQAKLNGERQVKRVVFPRVDF